MEILKLLGGASIATIVAISAVALIVVIVKLYVLYLLIKFLETQIKNNEMQIKKNEVQLKELEYKRTTYYTMRENEMINVTRACTQIIKYLKIKNRQEREETQETE